MRYAVLLYVDSGLAAGPGAPEWDASLPDHRAFNSRPHVSHGMALHDRGSATSLRVRDGERLITDGPFAETKEQLGGFYVLDCKDLDEALAWAAKIPTAKSGCVEIRPVIQYD